jgi:hypothetical protein
VVSPASATVPPAKRSRVMYRMDPLPAVDDVPREYRGPLS